MAEDVINIQKLPKSLSKLTSFLGGAVIGPLLVWLILVHGGFAWQSKPELQFNWHPLLMTIGFVIFNGNGILEYRRPHRRSGIRELKIGHAIINLISFIFIVIGLKAVFDSHNLNKDANGLLKPIPNMHSLHSWIGLSVVILFATQWLFGFLAFLVPVFGASLRAFYLPIHKWFGLAIFVGGVASALTGLTQMAIFSVSEYSARSREVVWINIIGFIGLLLIIFCGLTVFLVSNPKFKREIFELPRIPDNPIPTEGQKITIFKRLSNLCAKNLK